MKVSDLSGALLDYVVARADESWKWAHQMFPTWTLDSTFYGVEIRGESCVLIPNNPMRQDPREFRPSSDWYLGGQFIERDQIFLEPPHDVHRLNYGPDGKPKGCWQSFDTWHATVSARTRTYPNPSDPSLPSCVGRGEGDTALIAVMRAVVASHYGAYVPNEVMP